MFIIFFGEFGRWDQKVSTSAGSNACEHIADPSNRPLVFHCSHGVHRTGTAATILLSLLGVDWSTARADYLVSNDVRSGEVSQRLTQMRSMAAQALGVDPGDVDMTNMEAFMVQDGTYINASRDQIVNDFGSLDSFYREGLGLTDATIQQLRDQLVTPSP